MQMLSYQNLTLVCLWNCEKPRVFTKLPIVVEQQFNQKNKRITAYINIYF